MSQSPPAPTYVLRGHSSAIHALDFFASNTYLASGDTDGWLVVWKLSSKRPVAVWKAHEGGVMQIKHWTGQRLVTHGRDHTIRVWQVRSQDFAVLSTRLPNEASTDDEDHQQQPWLLHSLSANALNFCAFSLCDQDPEPPTPALTTPTPQLLASPNGLDSGGVDIFQLPSERRVSQLRSDPTFNTGMVMAVKLSHEVEPQTSKLLLISGYEDGHVMVHSHSGTFDDKDQGWVKLMVAKPHSQPVLSLDISPSKDYFVTSSADALVAKFSLHSIRAKQEMQSRNADKTVNTKHAGQQGLVMRSDGKIFATAGWDGRIRIYSSKTMKELAVLKWHKDGCYATDFAEVIADDQKGHVDQEVHGDGGTELATRMTALDHIKQERDLKARSTHWLAAGGKDGKITLWEVY